MKFKSLLHLVVVFLVGQFLFSCNTAEYYRFAASTPETYSKAKVKSAITPDLATPSIAEEMVAASEVEPAPETVAPVLEASTAAPTPVLLEKKALKNLATPAVSENKTLTKVEEAAAVEMAKERLSTMTKAEKKAFKKELKASFSNPNAVGMAAKIILSFLLPPLAVFLHEGISTRFWISILLTILFIIPGIVYALLVVTDTI